MSTEEVLVKREGRYVTDDYPWGFTITRKSTGAAIDITGWTFTITFNTERDPEDATNQQFQSTGVITDGPNGQMEIPFVGNTLPVGDLYYDIRAIDNNSRQRTIEKGTCSFWQPINQT